MVKKATVAFILIFLIMQISSCTSKTNNQEYIIRFYKTFNESTGELSEPTETIKTGRTEYVLFDYGKPFNSSSIGMTVYEDLDGERGSVYDIIDTVEPDATAVVFPIEIANAGKYELVIYFESPDEPIATTRLYVVDR